MSFQTRVEARLCALHSHAHMSHAQLDGRLARLEEALQQAQRQQSCQLHTLHEQQQEAQRQALLVKSHQMRQAQRQDQQQEELYAMQAMQQLCEMQALQAQQHLFEVQAMHQAQQQQLGELLTLLAQQQDQQQANQQAHWAQLELCEKNMQLHSLLQAQLQAKQAPHQQWCGLQAQPQEEQSQVLICGPYFFEPPAFDDAQLAHEAHQQDEHVYNDELQRNKQLDDDKHQEHEGQHLGLR